MERIEIKVRSSRGMLSRTLGLLSLLGEVGSLTPREYFLGEFDVMVWIPASQWPHETRLAFLEITKDDAPSASFRLVPA